MTDQQRTARIDFVKKLLVANGFVSFKDLNPHAFGFKKDNYFKYKVFLQDDFISISRVTPCCKKELIMPNYVIQHHQPLKRLREFIKISNQNHHE